MTNDKQPAALADHPERQLEMVGRWYMVNKMGMATLCVEKEDAEQEAADAQMAWPHMGPHRAVRLVESADVEAMRTGYAAARLEIESLQARIKSIVEERSDELMVAHLDGRMRAEQPVVAQQPGAAYAALPDADRDYMRKVVAVAVTMLFDGYKEDVTRVFSLGELSEFATITAAMVGERVEDIYRRAWDLLSLSARASHGQAPAAPAQAIGPCVICGSDEPFTGTCGSGGDPRALCKQPAPQQEAQEPCPSCRNSDIYACTCPFPTSRNAAPQPSPASQGDALDAARYRWLRRPHLAAGHGSISVVLDDRANGHMSRTIWLDRLDAAIDAARTNGDTP